MPARDTAALLTARTQASLHGIILMSRFQAALMPPLVRACLRLAHVCVEQEAPFSVRQLSDT